jgi:hypothetical protein
MKSLFNLIIIFSCLLATMGSTAFAAPGDLAWSQTDTARRVIFNGATNSSGNLFYANWYGTNEFQAIAKDKNGSTLWSRNYNSMVPVHWPNVTAHDALIADNNFIFLIRTLVVLPNTDTNYSRLFIAKISAIDGSVIATYLSPTDSYFSNQNAVAVDETGIYIGVGENSSGGVWKLQKFTKNLSLVWSNVSAPLGTNDEAGPKRLLLNAGLLYAGGTILSGGGSARLDIYDKNTGVKLDTKIQNGVGSIGSMAVVDSSLYTTVAPLEMYHWPVPLSNSIGLQSTFQRRDLLGNLQHSASFAYKITDLAPASSGSLYLAYTDDALNHYGRFKVVDSSGNTISPIVNTGVVNQGGGLYRLAVPLMNNLVVANEVIYFVGRDSSSAFLSNGKVEAYSHLVSINTSPTAPTLSGPTTGITSGSYTFGATATDPDAGATIRYGFDWDMNGSVDTWAPATGYVASGVAQSATQSWASPGAKTFQVLAEDEKGGRSAWAQHVITINDQPQFIVCPAATTLYVGDTYSLQARYWSNSPTVPGCSTPGYTDVTGSANWTSSNTTVATVTNATTRGEVEVFTPGFATITSTYSGLSDTTAVTGTLPVPVIDITSAASLIRSGNTTEVTVTVTADYNATCTVYGAESSPRTLTHTASPTAVTYPAITTKALTSAQIVQVDCVADGYPSISASDQLRISVVPTIQEI